MMDADTVSGFFYKFGQGGFAELYYYELPAEHSNDAIEEVLYFAFKGNYEPTYSEEYIADREGY